MAKVQPTKLDFVKPMPAISITEFTFKPRGDQTAVTWTMSGQNGGYFEKGLANLKAVAEAASRK